MTGAVDAWLWIGAGGMLIGWVLLLLPLASNKVERDESDLMAHFFVPLIAFTLYLLMALGGGHLVTGIGRTYYYGRYIDWIVTTPLLLYSLVTSGLQGTGIKRTGMLVGLLGADVYMILTGFVAGLTDRPSLKWSFYACSCASFLAIYALLFGPYKKLTATGPHGADFAKKAVVLSAIWLAYPIVFLLGQEGARAWPPIVDAVLFTILDLLAKVAYGLWAVGMAKKSSAALPADLDVARTAAIR